MECELTVVNDEDNKDTMTNTCVEGVVRNGV